MSTESTDLPTRAQRRRMLKGAKIVYKDGFASVDCTVRNASDTGFLIRVDGALSMPDEFRLRIDGRDVGCRVVRRLPDHLGVALAD